MKPYKFYLINALLTVLISASFSVGTAYATTGCFPDTNGHWAETFICWLKDNAITSGYADGTYKPENGVTRAEMSVFLQKVFNLADASAQTRASTAETNAKVYADLLVNTPPATGEIRINSSPNSWDFSGNQPGPGTLTIFRNDAFFGLTSSVANTTHVFLMTPDFPSGLYGRKLNVTGMEYCYTTSFNARVNGINAWLGAQTSGASSTYTMLFNDSTVRVDAACRYYSFEPQALDDNSILSVYAYIGWNSDGAGATILLGRVTFFFQPTTTALPAPQAAETIPPTAPDEPKPIP